MKAVWVAIQFLIGYNLVLPFLLYIYHNVIGKTKKKFSLNESQPDYAIIITAYEQIEGLPALVNSILKINYINYHVYVVADKCDVSSLNFANEKITLLNPEETLGSNTKSHFYAISRFIRNHERLTIIDSDNLVDKNYLIELNNFFDYGYKAVQGIRKAKNLDTTYACLDAARDIYYHYYDGKLLFESGSSATLAGSGMAFTTVLYRECLEHLEIKGAGFDKILQYEIVKRKERIAFAENAIVYDQKTSYPDQLVKQRSRWISTWFRYSFFGLHLLRSGIGNLNLNEFLFGFILLRPPLFIFLSLSLMCLFISFYISPLSAVAWLFSLILFCISFAIPLFSFNTDKRILYSLAGIPRFVYYQFLSLLKIKKADKNSAATKHFYQNTKQTIST